MTKTVLAFATAFLAVMTVLAPAAEACISCEHVPVVVRGSSTSYTARSYTKKRYAKKRLYKAAKKLKARPAKKRIAKRKTITKKVRTAKTAPIKTQAKTQAENENSTISTALVDTDETVETGTTETTESKVKDEPKAPRNVTCKKFFPTVGMTLTVPCE